MSTITWLHLSDLHLRGTETSVDRGTFNDMLSDIEERLEEEGLNLDAVFFTGDVAFSGQVEQYEQATERLDEILEACGLSGQRNRFFIVPGNHDVDRGEVNRTKGICRLHEDNAKDLLDPDKPYGEINEFLGPDPDRELVFAKFQNFARFIDMFFSDEEIKFDYNRYYFVRSIDKEGHTVVVIGLNSAWLSFRDNEQGQLLLGERQVCDAIEEAKRKWPDACLRIALVHHPLYWLAEKDIHKVQQHLPRKCDLLLRGHLHCPSFSVQSTPDSHLHVFAAGASLKANYHAYNFVQLDLDTGEGTAIVRLQHPEIGGNWGADSFTYRNAKEGKIALSLVLGK
ncbi:MAG: metallophosphoesterase [Chloroflexi bacterium]|nr:metallophosphoesterase [Chloroflexota bacterium]